MTDARPRGRQRRRRGPARARRLAMVYGVLMLIGARPAARTRCSRWPGSARRGAAVRRRPPAHVEFTRVKTLADLEREVAAAQAAGQTGDARLLCGLVRVLQGNGALHLHRRRRAGRVRAGALLLQADVTANDAERPGPAAAASASSGRRPSCSSMPPGRDARSSASWASSPPTSSAAHRGRHSAASAHEDLAHGRRLRCGHGWPARRLLPAIAVSRSRSAPESPAVPTPAADAAPARSRRCPASSWRTATGSCSSLRGLGRTRR